MDHTSLALLGLADRLTAMETKVSDISRPQLAHSSIVDGAIDQVKMVDTGEVDDNGFPIFTQEVVARVGEQEDGGNGVSVFTGPVPPRPVNFSVVGGPGILTVEWLGEFEDRYEPYSDHAYVNVHVSTSPDFIPDASTIKAAILSPQGEQVTISGLDPAPYYVTLVAVSQAGIWSLPAPFDGDDTTSQVDPVWVSAIEKKADDAQAAADAAQSTADSAKAAADLASSDAVAARDAATQAQADATTALQTANGKSTVFYSTTDPDPAKGTDGDTWYKRTATAFGTITGAWEKRSGTWEARLLTDQVIDSLSAGKITSGTLGVGQVITVGSPSDGTGAYLQIGNSNLTTYRQDIDGNWTPSLQLGGPTDTNDPNSFDQVSLIDPVSGEAIVGMSALGIMWTDDLVTSTLSVGGQSLGNYLVEMDDVLSPFPRGRVATYILPNTSYPQASGELGVAEIAWDMQQNRLYRIVFDGNINSGALNSTFRLFMRFSTSADTSSEAPTPTISSNVLSWGVYASGAAGTAYARAHLEGDLGIGLPERQAKVLLSLQRMGGGYPAIHPDGRNVLYVEDIGVYPGALGDAYGKDGQLNTGGGTPYTGGTTTTTTTPTATKKTYTKTYNATWTSSWRSGVKESSSELRQGAGFQAAVGFPSQIATDLTGSSVAKVEVYLYAHHWYYNNGGTLRLGAHGATSSPASVPTVQTATPFDVNWTSKTGGKWVTLPSSWYPYFISGAYRGIFVGAGVGSSASNTYYSRLDGTGYTYPPQLRITYTK